MYKRDIHIVGLLALLFASVYILQAQTVEGVYAGFKGDKQTWTDRYTKEGMNVIKDEIRQLAGGPGREVELRPTETTGEVYRETVGGALANLVVLKNDFINFYQGQALNGMIMVEAPPVVFDPTVPTHYGYFLSKMYDMKKGGVQKFTVVVPSKNDYSKLEVSKKASVSIAMGNGQKTASVYQFRIEFNEYVTVWILDDVVAAVYIPSKDEYMVDAKYPQLHQQIQMLIKRAM